MVLLSRVLGPSRWLAAMSASVVFCQPVTCPLCAGPLLLLNSRASGTHSVAILECDPCEKEFEFTGCLRFHAPSQKAVAREMQSRRRSKARARERVNA